MKLSAFQFVDFFHRAETLGWDVKIYELWRNKVYEVVVSGGLQLDEDVLGGYRFQLDVDNVVTEGYEDVLEAMEKEFKLIDERNRKALDRKALIESLTPYQRELLELN